MNCTLLANILHLNNQVSIQHIHRTPWYFKNDSQPSMDSRNLKFKKQFQCPISVLEKVFLGMLLAVHWWCIYNLIYPETVTS
jgi:hypothetical protein